MQDLLQDGYLLKQALPNLVTSPMLPNFLAATSEQPCHCQLLPACLDAAVLDTEENQILFVQETSAFLAAPSAFNNHPDMESWWPHFSSP